MVFKFKCYSENEWRDDSKIDRAFVWPTNGEEVGGLILWQNSFECHKCSWIRARDIDGNIIPPFSQNPPQVTSSGPLLVATVKLQLIY